MALRLYNERGELVTDSGLAILARIEDVLIDIKDTDNQTEKLNELIEAIKEITKR